MLTLQIALKFGPKTQDTKLKKKMEKWISPMASDVNFLLANFKLTDKLQSI